MPKIIANGINLYYECHGEGFPILLIPGFTADHHVWHSIVNQLKQIYKVILMDNRDVGQSGASHKSYTVEDMAYDAIALLKALEISQVDVLGHSMGTAIAQIMAIHNPEKIRNLLLFNTFSKINFVTKYAFRSTENLLKARISKEIIVESVIPWLFSNTSLSNKIFVHRFVKGLLNVTHPQSLLGFQRQFEALKGFDSTDQLHEIKNPTLIVAGESDILCPLQNTQLVADRIPRAKLVIVPDTAHMSHVEKPEACLKIIHNFIS